MKVEEFIEAINEGEFWALCYIDDTDLWEDFEIIQTGNDLDEHRWYSTAENIYKLEDGYVGVRGLFQVFSELSCFEDFKTKCYAYEVEPVPSVKYVKKNR